MPDNLVTMRGGPGPVIAFVHSASGLVTGFRRLVPHLRRGGAVYAFASVEPGSEQSTIATVAASYWDQLREAVNGPLVLAGWSFGGAVALRMASLAEAAGCDVRCVVLIDSGTPELLSTRTDSVVEQLAGLFELDPADLAHGTDVADLDAALELIAARLGVLHGDEHIDVADLRPFVEVHDWHIRVARRAWRPQPVTAPVVLVRARDEKGWGDVPTDLGWSSALGHAPEIVWTPGNHHDLMSARHAPHLAGVLNLVTAEHPGPAGTPGPAMEQLA
ncbi:thioesterase domain-containing protein [Lentzea sp. NPDC004789]